MVGVFEVLFMFIFKKFNIIGILLGFLGNNFNFLFFGGGISIEGILFNVLMVV